MVKIGVDQERCVGSGQCVLLADDVFDQRDEDGIVVLLSEDVPADRLDDVREASRVCPAQAIMLDGS